MTRIERENIEALARKAKGIRDVWLREREVAQEAQISANADVAPTRLTSHPKRFLATPEKTTFGQKFKKGFVLITH